MRSRPSIWTNISVLSPDTTIGALKVFGGYFLLTAAFIGVLILLFPLKTVQSARSPAEACTTSLTPLSSKCTGGVLGYNTCEFIPDGNGDIPWQNFTISGNANHKKTTYGNPGDPHILQIDPGDGNPFVAGTYITFPTIPGTTYCASWRWGPNTDSGTPKNPYEKTLGLDPQAGSDPTAPSIIWGSTVSKTSRHLDYNPVGEDVDYNADIKAVATGTAMTLFVKAAYNANINSFIQIDQVNVFNEGQSGVGAPTPTTQADTPPATPTPTAVPVDPVCSIQGFKHPVQSGNDTDTLSLYTSAGDLVTQSSGQPYFLEQLASGQSYRIQAANTSGTLIGSTLCYNRTDCHADVSASNPSFQSGAERTVACPAAGGFGDLWWHYEDAGAVPGPAPGEATFTVSVQNAQAGPVPAQSLYGFQCISGVHDCSAVNFCSRMSPVLQHSSQATFSIPVGGSVCNAGVGGLIDTNTSFLTGSNLSPSSGAREDQWIPPNQGQRYIEHNFGWDNPTAGQTYSAVLTLQEVAPQVPTATPTPVVGDLSTIPDCTLLVGPDVVEVGKEYIYTMNTKENTNGPVTGVAMSVVTNDASGNPMCTDGQAFLDSRYLVSGPDQIAAGEASHKIRWTPSRPGSAMIYGRVWNDGIAECRAACTGSDPSTSPPTPEANLCQSALSCRKIVTVTGPGGTHLHSSEAWWTNEETSSTGDDRIDFVVPRIDCTDLPRLQIHVYDSRNGNTDLGPMIDYQAGAVDQRLGECFNGNWPDPSAEYKSYYRFYGTKDALLSKGLPRFIRLAVPGATQMSNEIDLGGESTSVTPECEADRLAGDYNCDGIVSIEDFHTWLQDFSEGKTTLAYLGYWQRAYVAIGGVPPPLPPVTATPVPGLPATATPVANAPTPTTAQNAIACPTVSSNAYDVIAIESDAYPAGDPAPNSHPDLNLSVRGYEQASDSLDIFDARPFTDPTLPPQLNTLFSPPRQTAALASVHKIFDWTWNTAIQPSHGTRGGAIANPPVTMVGISATPGEVLYPPISDSHIGENVPTEAQVTNPYQVFVLYADDSRITLKYARGDRVTDGYVVHVEDVCVDPSLVAVYNDRGLNNPSNRGSLIALRSKRNAKTGSAIAGDPIGVAKNSEVKVSIRGGLGTFFDPRSNDWWRNL